MNKSFWRAACIRAVRTMAQCLIAYIGSATLVSQVDWRGAASAALLGGVLSILMAIATGLPEVSDDGNHR